MKKAYAIGLVLVLLVAFGTALAEDSPQSGGLPVPTIPFPDGLNWDVTEVEISAVEAVDDLADYLLQETEDAQVFWLAAGPAQTAYTGTYYVYLHGQLAVFGIDYFPYSEAGYTALQDDLTLLYGEPADADPAQVVAMFNAYEDHFPPDILESAVSWAPAEDTRVHFVNISGELYVYWANSDRLFVDGAQ